MTHYWKFIKVFVDAFLKLAFKDANKIHRRKKNNHQIHQFIPFHHKKPIIKHQFIPFHHKKPIIKHQKNPIPSQRTNHQTPKNPIPSQRTNHQTPKNPIPSQRTNHQTPKKSHSITQNQSSNTKKIPFHHQKPIIKHQKHPIPSPKNQSSNTKKYPIPSPKTHHQIHQKKSHQIHRCLFLFPGSYAWQHEVHWTLVPPTAPVRQGHRKRDLHLGWEGFHGGFWRSETNAAE